MNVVANGFIIVNSYRVLSVVSVDIIVHAIVFSEVKVLMCVACPRTVLLHLLTCEIRHVPLTAFAGT